MNTVYALTFAGLNFHVFCIFTFAVAEPQAGEIKPCVGFCGAKLSRMVADLRKPQKFNPAKVKAYTVCGSNEL